MQLLLAPLQAGGQFRSPSALLEAHPQVQTSDGVGVGPLHPRRPPRRALGHFSLKAAARQGLAMVQEFTSLQVKGKRAQVHQRLRLDGGGWWGRCVSLSPCARSCTMLALISFVIRNISNN